MDNLSYHHQRHISAILSMSTMYYSYDEHNELITALLAGRWWAIMEVEDLLCLSSKKNECGDLTSGQLWGIVEAPQGAPVTPPQYQQGGLVPARFLEEDQEEIPGSFPEAALVPTLGQEEAPVPILSPEKAPVADESLQETPVPTRHQLRGKLKIPPNMRLYVTRDSILTPLPLRPPKGPPSRPAKSPKGAPVPASSPGLAPVPTRYPEEVPGPASAQVEAPVPASSPKDTPVASMLLKEAYVPISSLEGALVAEGAPVPARHQMKVSENKRLFLKSDVILTPLPLKALKGPPPRPAKTRKVAAVPASCAREVPVLSLPLEEGPVPTLSQEKAPESALSQEEAPVSTETNKEILVPARSLKKAPVPASPQKGAPVTTGSSKEVPMYLKGSPGLSVSLQGAAKSTLKRPCPWSSEDSESADVVQPPPHKKCVRKDPRASPSFQETLKRPCPWSTETSDSEDVIQLPLQKKQRVGKGPKDTLK